MNAFAQPSAAPVVGPQLDNRRVLAALVDLLVIGAGGFVLGLVIALINGTDAEWGGGMQALAVAWALYYYFAFESGDGQTLGKKLLKIRVIRADGGPAGMREIAIRTVLRVVDGLFLYLVGLIVMLVTGQRRQRLGDIAAGTVVADATTSPAPQVNAATAVPPAAVGMAGLEQPEAIEPHESTAVDVGTSLGGLAPPATTDTPELTEFEPFAEPAPEREYLAGPGIEPNVEAEPSEEPYPAGPGIEPNVEPSQEPYPAVGPTHEPVSELSPQPEEPHVEASTQWPHMYAARAEQAQAEQAHAEAWSDPDEPVEEFAEPVDEFVEPVDEFVEEPVEDLTEEPVEDLTEEPVEDLVEEPAEEPTSHAEYSRPAELQGPDLPAAELDDPQPAEPAEDLLADAARAAEQPAESEVPGLPGAPSDHSEEPEEQVTVRSVETVSPIDLVMGNDQPDGEQIEDADQGASEDTDSSASEDAYQSASEDVDPSASEDADSSASEDADSSASEDASDDSREGEQPTAP